MLVSLVDNSSHVTRDEFADGLVVALYLLRPSNELCDEPIRPFVAYNDDSVVEDSVDFQPVVMSLVHDERVHYIPAADDAHDFLMALLSVFGEMQCLVYSAEVEGSVVSADNLEVTLRAHIRTRCR